MTTCVTAYIDGEWRPRGSADVTQVVNPFTEEAWAEATVTTPDEVDLAVRSAHRAITDWSSTPFAERVAAVREIQRLLADDRVAIATAQSRSMGAPFAKASTLFGSLDLIDMFVEYASGIDFDFVRQDRFCNAMVSRRPVGVVGGVVPWNAPVRSEVKKVIPALLAGCSIVLKPAPETPLGAARFVEICTEAGVPPGVVNLVPGGPTTGEALVGHPLVRKIAFTGSTATGARIASIAGASLKRVQLELGGKSAAIVLDDVDLATALPLLVGGAWANAGQACVAAARVFVPRRRHAEIIDALAGAAAAQVLGDPLDPATTMGPLVSSRQRERVLGYIDVARDEGARIVTGGGRPAHLDRGYFVAPTVLADVRNDMRVAREEIFGPVTCVIPYDSVDHAVAMANDSSYGLFGYVFGRDEAHALSVARRLETGGVAVNQYLVPMSAPFGGVKDSGIGREHGREGFDSFLEYSSYGVSAALASSLREELPTG